MEAPLGCPARGVAPRAARSSGGALGRRGAPCACRSWPFVLVEAHAKQVGARPRRAAPPALPSPRTPPAVPRPPCRAARGAGGVQEGERTLCVCGSGPATALPRGAGGEVPRRRSERQHCLRRFCFFKWAAVKAPGPPDELFGRGHAACVYSAKPVLQGRGGGHWAREMPRQARGRHLSGSLAASSGVSSSPAAARALAPGSRRGPPFFR